HIDEAAALAPIRVETQVIEGKGKKMRLFHSMYHGDGRLLATGEHMLVHVSLETRAACAPAPAVEAKLVEIAGLHEGLPVPDGAGRAVGQGR
ncbi:MAG: thioesterase family protein, partial [Paracoccaceae bacterium]